MSNSAALTTTAPGLLRRVLRTGARTQNSPSPPPRPTRKLAAAALVLAVAATVTIPTAAQAHEHRGAIAGLTLTSDTPGVLDVAWDAPAGAAPTDYRVSWARSGEDWPSWTDQSANLHPTTTSQQISGLDEGAEYKVRVRARYHHAAGGPWSGPWAEATQTVDAAAAVQAQQDPGAIAGLTLTSDTPGVLDVAWDAPAGAAPTDYRVSWARSGEDWPSWTDQSANLHPTTTNQQISGLDEGAEYKVRVRARYHHAAGGPWSGPWAEATQTVDAAEPTAGVRSDDEPPVTLIPPKLAVIELDTDDPDDPDVPLVALQQSDGSVSEPADGDLPADTTTDGVLIVDGNGVTGRHTDNVTDRHLDDNGNRYHWMHPDLYAAEDVDWYAVDLQADAFYQFDVKHNGGNLPVYRMRIYDSTGNAVMVTVGTGMNERQVAVDNNFGVPGNLPSQRNALPFQPDTAGRYYVSIAAPKGGIAPNRVYTLSVQSDDYEDDTSTTAVVAVGGSIRTYIMRTETSAGITSTRDFDFVKVALQSGVTYRFVLDVACLHEGLIYILDSAAIFVSLGSIDRETDGHCTDLAIEYTPPTSGDYFIRLTARGSDFPKNGPTNPSRYAFQGVWGTLTVERIS